MKRYKLELVIHEGNDEFWEQIRDQGITGCELIQDAVASAIESIGFTVNASEVSDDTLKVVEYEDKE